MTSTRHFRDESRGALFWLAVGIAVLLPVRMVMRAVDAPMAPRLGLGIILISALVVLAALMFVGRLRGMVGAGSAMAGVLGTALFLLGFVLTEGHGTVVTATASVAGLVGVGAALVAAFRA